MFLRALFLVIVGSALFSVQSLAVQNQSITSVEYTATSPWMVDGMMQFHSVSGKSSPLIGAGIAYSLNLRNLVGVRAMMSFSGTALNGAYAAQGYWRYYFMAKKTRLFTELNVNANVLNTYLFPSAGVALGVTRYLVEDLSIGGIAGIESTKNGIDELGAYPVKEIVVYPKLAIFMGLHY